MRNLTKTAVIILAAGIGSRLYSLTKHYPKSLIKVNGREILDYQIKGYLNAGLKEENIHIITGYKHEMINEFLALNYPKVKQIYNPDYHHTNNMYSLYLGLNEVIKHNPQCLFINNADCIYDENLMKEFINTTLQNAIAVEFSNYNDESMKVIARKDKSLTHIAKTIPKEKSLGISIDLYKFSSQATKTLLELIKDFIEIKKDLKQWSEVAFVPLFKREKVIAHNIGTKKWVEIDNEFDLAIADRLFSSFDIHSKKALICDMDGTLYVGNQAIKDSIDFIKHSTAELYFYTNNSSKIPSDYMQKLRSFGIETDLAHILTPLQSLINYLKEKQYSCVYLVANAKVSKYLQDCLPNVDFSFHQTQNQAIVLTYDTQLTYAKLQNICTLLNHTNAEFIATHSDIFCPSECGAIPDIGSFIALLKAVTQKSPDIVLGKPNPSLAKPILSKYKAGEIAVIGDRLQTDKKFADNLQCDFICVLTGETKRLDIQKHKGKFPKLIVQNLKALTKKLEI